jgi:transcriptional regulator with GAF, ATPase, and Fis domain
MEHHIQRVLELAGGKVQGPGGAAELLGVNASTLRNRMKRLAVPYGRKLKT